MCENFIEIDGSVLEGGGQILRNSVAFSGLMKKSIRITNIRAGRSSPGLRPQHLAGLRLARDICSAIMTGDEIGSTMITFSPSEVKGGEYNVKIGTAGSVMLVFQVALPLLLYADKPSELTLEGGTNVSMAPQIDYTLMVFKPIAELLGVKFSIVIKKRGYYPIGGGHIIIKIDPINSVLKPIEMLNLGHIIDITGRSFVAGKLPLKMSHNVADIATRLLKKHFPKVVIDINGVKEPYDTAVGNGNGIILVAKTDAGQFIGGSALGRKGISDEKVADIAANEIIEIFEKKACIDNYTQDQLIIFLTLAKGKSKIHIADCTLHTKTAIFIAEILTGVKFAYYTTEKQEFIMECEGIGYQQKPS